MVDLDPLTDDDFEVLKTMINNHLKYTGSNIAEKILKQWREESLKFIKVFPREYKNVVQSDGADYLNRISFEAREVANG